MSRTKHLKIWIVSLDDQVAPVNQVSRWDKRKHMRAGLTIQLYPGAAEDTVGAPEKHISPTWEVTEPLIKQAESG